MGKVKVFGSEHEKIIIKKGALQKVIKFLNPECTINEMLQLLGLKIVVL